MRRTGKIQTTHVGSLPRSDALVAALLARDRGDAQAAADCDRAIADAVAEVVRHQAELGIDIISDGEQGKVSYSTYVTDRLSGFGGADTLRRTAKDWAEHPELRAKMLRMTGAQEFRRLSCIGPIAVKDMAPLHTDIANLKAAAKGTDAGLFMNSASPGLVTAFQPNQFYPSHEAYLAALVPALAEEYRAIVDAGIILQLDCPDLAMAAHISFQDLSEAEFLKRAESHVEAMNAALDGIPAERVRMHICWGNYEGPHDHDIEVRKLFPVLKRAKPQAILFEAANPRHEHEWVNWMHSGLDDKVLVPGVIDSSTNYVEHPELVAQRIDRWVEVAGEERLIAGTDCGFGTFAGYSKMDAKAAWKKLGSLVEGARLAS